MNYQAEISPDRTISLQNDGQHTTITLAGEGQNQSSSFPTGNWSRLPQLFAIGDGFVVQLSGEEGEKFLSIDKNGAHSLDKSPDLQSAKSLDLKESDDDSPELKPMAPMQPMTPMKPMN